MRDHTGAMPVARDGANDSAVDEDDLEVGLVDASEIDLDDVTIESAHAVTSAEEAEADLEEVVTGRRAFARNYLRRLRRRNPEATPSQLADLVERHYVGAIATAGAAIAASGVALEIGIGLIPMGGAATATGKAVAKQAAKQAAKGAAKRAVKEAMLSGAKQAASVALPKGDQAAQFELTTVFALALAELHGLAYDQEQSKALVYGLTSDIVDDRAKAVVAHRLSRAARRVDVPDDDGEDSPPWAQTLAAVLPGEEAASFVTGLQEAGLDQARQKLGARGRAGVDLGVDALAAGAARFVFGRQVVDAARAAFGEPPMAFPAWLDLESADEDEPVRSRVVAALEDATHGVGESVALGARAVGSGVSSAASTVSRPFRRVDLDGDGIPDDPQALSAAKNAGRAVSAAVGSLGNRFKMGLGRHRHGHEEGDPSPESSTE